MCPDLAPEISRFPESEHLDPDISRIPLNNQILRISTMQQLAADYIDSDNKITKIPSITFINKPDTDALASLSDMGRCLFILKFLFSRSPIGNGNTVKSNGGGGNTMKATGLLINGWPDDNKLLQIMTAECLASFKSQVSSYYYFDFFLKKTFF